jgi:hypothetical protein
MIKSETVSATHYLHLLFENDFCSQKYLLHLHLNQEQSQVIDYCNLSVRTIEIFTKREELDTVKTVTVNISM